MAGQAGRASFSVKAMLYTLQTGHPVVDLLGILPPKDLVCLRGHFLLNTYSMFYSCESNMEA
jgi:hypothetical protein